MRTTSSRCLIAGLRGRRFALYPHGTQTCGPVDPYKGARLSVAFCGMVICDMDMGVQTLCFQKSSGNHCPSHIHHVIININRVHRSRFSRPAGHKMSASLLSRHSNLKADTCWLWNVSDCMPGRWLQDVEAS